MCSYASPQILVLKYIFDSLLARSIAIYISCAQAVSLCFENAFKRKHVVVYGPLRAQHAGITKKDSTMLSCFAH